MLGHPPSYNPSYQSNGHSVVGKAYSPPFHIENLLSGHEQPHWKQPPFFARRPTPVKPRVFDYHRNRRMYQPSAHRASYELPTIPGEDDVFCSYRKMPYHVAVGSTYNTPETQSHSSKTAIKRKKRHHSEADVQDAERRLSTGGETGRASFPGISSNLKIQRQHETADTDVRIGCSSHTVQHYPFSVSQAEEPKAREVPPNCYLRERPLTKIPLPEAKQPFKRSTATASASQPTTVKPAAKTTAMATKSPSHHKKQHPSGRFRPPPFFQTVKELRKHLYALGNRQYDVDEPPSDKRTQRVWRAMEKFNTPYSLQHYFFVASLSNRCFRKVESIVDKVHSGLLEGSREQEVNQSYFNFLYGKSEDVRYGLLILLESGEVKVKALMKQKSPRSLKRASPNVDQNEMSLDSEQDATPETDCNEVKGQHEKLLLLLKSKEDEISALKSSNQKLCEQVQRFLININNKQSMFKRSPFN